MKRLLSLLAVIAMVLSLFAGCGSEETQIKDPVPDNFKGIVLAAASDVTVTLYTEFKDGTPIPPSQTYETETMNYYCFNGLFGAYRYKAHGNGYYTVTQNISVTEEKNQQKTVMDVTPGKLSGNDWETDNVLMFTDELLSGGFNDDISQWPAYADVFTTPHYTEEHGQHQMTTQEQMETFIRSLDDGDDDLYIYSAGISGMYRHDIPLVIFTRTDLSGADTVEKAAEALDNGKPTIFYRAQIHGNEPAGGEAALAVIKLLDTTWSDYLQTVNICIVPRGNPDGAQNYDRKVMGGVDPNRDNLRIRTPEVESYIRLCRILNPTLIIDGHEYDAKTTSQSVSGGDMLVGVGYTNENTAAFRDLSITMSQEIFTDLAENGLDCRYYSNYTNTVNSNISRSYASRQGTLFFLLETRGIDCGLSSYSRRIITHVISVESLFDYFVENTAQVVDTVAAEQQNIVEKGGVYDSDDRIALSTKAGEDLTLRHDLNKYDQLTGQPEKSIATPKVYNLVQSDRIAPTAYVIPAGEGFTDNVLKLMDKHGIAYTFIPEGSRVRLQQYNSNEADCLSDETTVTFEKGAYVFCKNQVRGIILSMLMEPDIADLEGHSGTLVQQGMIYASDGKFPLYRYIHDLNADGFIDYR